MHRDLILALSEPLHRPHPHDFVEEGAEESNLLGVVYDTFLRFA